MTESTTEITYEFIPRRHFLIYFASNPRISGSTKDNRFYSVVARNKNNDIIGVCGVSAVSPGIYSSYGTFVHADYRSKGIAINLWQNLLSSKPDIVQLQMSLISDDGEQLAKRLISVLPVKIVLTFQNKPNYKPDWAYTYEKEKIYAT